MNKTGQAASRISTNQMMTTEERKELSENKKWKFFGE